MNKNKKSGKQNNNASYNSANNWIIIAIILTVLGLYSRTIDYDFTLDDDLFYAKNQTVLQGVKGIPQIFQENSIQGVFKNNNIDDPYRPITLSSFAIQKQLFGINSKAAHFFNIFIYALCGILIFSVLKKIFPKWPLWVSGAITLLFIAHPIHTEVVCSIKSRDELLSCLFGFLFLRSILIYKESSSLKSILLSCMWLMLALLSKESSITFIGIAALIYYYSGELTLKQFALKLIPFGICVGVLLIIRNLVLTGDTSFSRGLVIYNSLNGATNFSELYGTRFEILFLFLQQVSFPVFLKWDYSFNQLPIVTLTSPIAILSIVLHLGLVFLTIYSLRKKDLMAFGLLFFFITSVVTNNFLIKVGATFAERFLFVPSLGYLIFLAGALAFLLKTPLESAVSNSKFKTVFSVLFISFCVITFARTPVWENNFALYTSGVETSPNSARTNGALASEYRIRAESSLNAQDKFNNYKLSRQYYLRSAEILPSYTDAYFNLGVIAIAQADSSKAIEWYKKALDTNPKYKNAMHSIAVIYLLKGQLDTALSYLNDIRKYYPDDYSEHPNFSFIYLTKKEYGEAKKYAEAGIENDPENPTNYRNMAAATYQLGDTTKAGIYWQKYLDLGGK